MRETNYEVPWIAIIDWETSPLDDTDGAVERSVIGDAAHVKRFLCSSDADINQEICGADAPIVWHNRRDLRTRIASISTFTQS